MQSNGEIILQIMLKYLAVLQNTIFLKIISSKQIITLKNLENYGQIKRGI